MRQFYVFIKCELGRTYDVASDIVDQIEEARHVHSVSGVYDLLAHFSVEGDEDIGRFVNQRLQVLPGIKDTQTILCFNAFTSDGGLGES